MKKNILIVVLLLTNVLFLVFAYTQKLEADMLLVNNIKLKEESSLCIQHAEAQKALAERQAEMAARAVAEARAANLEVQKLKQAAEKQ